MEQYQYKVDIPHGNHRKTFVQNNKNVKITKSVKNQTTNLINSPICEFKERESETDGNVIKAHTLVQNVAHKSSLINCTPCLNPTRGQPQTRRGGAEEGAGEKSASLKSLALT